MGILQSLNIGVTGLAASGNGMSVVADNIANSGTTGFKSSRAEFQDVLATSLKGVDGGDQMGAGVRLAHIKPVFTQGNVSRTENITDLAINGNGFFTIDAPFGKGYSRDGSFHFDKEGYMINSDGYKVMGFSADENGKITNKLDPIRLGNTNVPARATKNVDMMMNLDSREPLKQFSAEKPEESSSFNTSVTVYDSVGTARIVTTYFNKVSDNQWEYHAMVDGKDAAGGVPGKAVEMAKGKVIFSDKGTLQDVQESSNSFNFNKGAAPGQKIAFAFGKTIKSGGNGLEASTQYGSDSNVARHTQNGSSAASIASLSFNDAGVLTAVYNNGVSIDLSQISIAKFENNEGLFKVGKNLYKESRASGQVAMGKPGEGGRGEVLSKSIELSNVDMAGEFVGLMTAQRNFSANAKTLTAADQMLQEVLNIKR